MYISNISHMQNVYSNHKHCKPQETTPISHAQTDTINISQQAHAKLETENQTRDMSDLRPISLDPKFYETNAEERIKQLLKDHGLPENTPVKFNRNSQGNLSVSINHPQGEKLAETFAQDPELREQVYGIHNAMFFERIAKAHQQVKENVGEDYQSRLSALNWMQNFIQQSQSMSFTTEFDGNGMNSGFTDHNGKLVDHLNNFTVPQSFA